MSGGGEPAPKVAKISEEIDKNGETPSVQKEHKFKDFQIKKILNENSQRKMICLQGNFAGDEKTAVVILEKTPISEDTAGEILTDKSETKIDIENDIYHTYQMFPPNQFNGIKSSLIYPATEKHIAKYSAQEVFLVEETPEDYDSITLPYITNMAFSIQWVYNILEHKTESERIVCEDTDADTGFILLPDMKWDCKQVEDLYLVAIIHRHDLKSLRDLMSDHLPLLRNIRDKGISAIKEKYEVPKSKLRIYLHYQPSYYHLHVHFTHLKYDAPGSGTEKAHLLSDVINNIELDSKFYQKKTLSFILRANEGLCHKYKEAGRI